MIEKKSNVLFLDNKKIGIIKNDILIMNRQEDKHLYRVLDSWCLNIEVVNCGAKRFVIETKKHRYSILFETIKSLRSKVNMFVTFKTERQLAIPLDCWDKYDKPNLAFPSYIGITPSDFAENCDGRWRSRLIAYSQIELAL